MGGDGQAPSDADPTAQGQPVTPAGPGNKQPRIPGTSSERPHIGVVVGGVVTLALILFAGFATVMNADRAPDALAMAAAAPTTTLPNDTLTEEFCADPTPVVDAALPSAEMGNVFSLYEYHNGFAAYRESDLVVFNAAAFTDSSRYASQDMPELATAEPVYVGCIKLEQTGDNYVCRGYENRTTVKLWGQETKVDVYEIATAKLVASVTAQDRDTPSCPALTDGSSEFQAISNWNVALALVDLAIPNGKTLYNARVATAADTGWCANPTPLLGTADDALADSQADPENGAAPAVDVDAEAGPTPLQIIESGYGSINLSWSGEQLEYADSISTLDIVVCKTFVADEAMPTDSCEYMGGDSYDVPNGMFSVRAVDPATAEVIATSDFASDPGCPTTLLNLPDGPVEPRIEPAVADWLAALR